MSCRMKTRTRHQLSIRILESSDHASRNDTIESVESLSNAIYGSIKAAQTTQSKVIWVPSGVQEAPFIGQVTLVAGGVLIGRILWYQALWPNFGAFLQAGFLGAFLPFLALLASTAGTASLGFLFFGLGSFSGAYCQMRTTGSAALVAPAAPGAASPDACPMVGRGKVTTLVLASSTISTASFCLFGSVKKLRLRLGP